MTRNVQQLDVSKNWYEDSSVRVDDWLPELEITASRSNAVMADYLDQIVSPRLNGVFPKLCKFI